MDFLSDRIRINSLDSTKDHRQINDDGYDMISDDSILNDSRSEDLKDRINYSRDQLVNVFRTLVDLDYTPDWITNNTNFPKRMDANGIWYLKHLVNEDMREVMVRYLERNLILKEPVKRKPPTDMMSASNADSISIKKSNEENESSNELNNFRSNMNRPGQQENGAVYNNNYNKNYNGGFNNQNNNNFKINSSNNNKLERQTFGSNYRNNFNELRSRGENLNQNFASFRRPPNRNQYDRFNNNSRSEQPEWFTEGPDSQHDTIELKGFDDDEKGKDATKNQPQEQPPPPLQSQPQARSSQKQQPLFNFGDEETKDNFNINQLSSFDWQNVGAQHNADKVTMENQTDSSRFARFFKDPHLQNVVNRSANDEKIHTASRNVNHTPNIHHRMPFNHLSHQQQINVQNDFFGNLMNRQPQQQHAIKLQQPHPQQVNSNNRAHQPIPQVSQPNFMEACQMDNQSNKKTDQQLIDILQKARINVDSLMVQQNAFNKDNIIRGQAKSVEELEASLLSNNSPPHREHQIPVQSSHHHQINPAELFQKMCLNSNDSDRFNLLGNVQSQQVPIKHQPEENCAINPLVMDLLDAQKQRNIATSNKTLVNYPLMNNNMIKNQMNIRTNYMPNTTVFASHNQQAERREETVHPFTPTCVIRKSLSKERNSPIVRGVGEANFEAVTGSHLSERSMLSGRPLEEYQLHKSQMNTLNNNYTMNQADVMQRNFALATGNCWNESNVVQQNSIDSTTPNLSNHVDHQKKMIQDLLFRASTKPNNQTAFVNNATSKNQGNSVNQFVKVTQNEEKAKLFELLKRAMIIGKPPGTDSTGNKINDWFELEMQRNNNHLSPIIKENAFTLEDIENN